MRFLTEKWQEECNKVTYGNMDEEMRNRILWIERSVRIANKCTDESIKTLEREVDLDAFIDKAVLCVTIEEGKWQVRVSDGALIAENALVLAGEIPQNAVIKAIELEYVAEQDYELRFLVQTGEEYHECSLQCANVRAA